MAIFHPFLPRPLIRMNFKKPLLITAALFAVHGGAWACSGKDGLIFSCTTTKQKFVEVCDAGKTISYAFGKKGQTPELALSVPRAAASTYQWQGFGRTQRYAVTVPNGNTKYTVFHWTDTMEQTSSAGIEVEVGGKTVATLQCKGNGYEGDLEGVKLRPTE